MIQLTKHLWLKADEHCYIVGKPVESRGKGAELRNPRYYPTMARAVSGVLSTALRQGVADGSITTLREFIQEQARLQTEFEKLIAPLGGGQVSESGTIQTATGKPPRAGGRKE